MAGLGIHTGKFPFLQMLLCILLLPAVIVPGSTASPSPTSSREIMQISKESLPSSEGSQFAPQTNEDHNLPQEDKSDSQLPSLIDELNFDNIEKTPNPAFEQTNHILSKRQVRNDYERFYLCVFSFFTNPNCNQNNPNRQTGYNYGNVNNYNNNNDYGASSTTNTGYVPVFQGLFGQNQGFGLFGNRYQQNNGNNFYPYQTPATYAPFVYPTTVPATRPPTTTTIATSAMPVVMADYPKINQNQSPYPDPQVNRRPGPESLVNKSPPVTSTTPSPTTTSTPSTTTTTTTAEPPKVAVTFVPLEKLPTRVSFVPPSGVFPASSEVLKQQDQQDEDTHIVFDADRTDKPAGGSGSRITEKYDPNCVNGTTSTSESPKAAATFPILVFGDILAQATTPSTEANETAPSVTLPPKYPMKDPDYFKLKLKIQELERSNNALKVFYTDLAKKSSQLQKELNETIEQSEKLKKENAALQFNDGESQEQLVSFQTQTKYLQEALSAVKDEGSKLKVRINQLERTNNHLQQTNGQLQHGNSDHRIQINQLKDKVKYLEDKVIRMTADNYAKHLIETRELRDKIKKLESDYIQCRNQVYDMQRRLQSSSSDISSSSNNNKDKYSDSNDFDFKKRLGLVAEPINSNNNSSEEIVIEPAVEDETERNTELPTGIPGIVFQDEEIIPTVFVSGENSTEVSSSETTSPSIVEFNLPSKVQFNLNTTVDLGNSTGPSNSNETDMEILVLPDQIPPNFPFGGEFTSEIEVPGVDPTSLGMEVDPQFDVRIGDIGITGNGAITFGDDQGIEGGSNSGGIDAQSVYGQYPLFNVGQGYQSDGHDSPWRNPFYPGALNNLRGNLAYGQNAEFFRRQL